MTTAELREKYLAFFKERGHTVVPSASIVPENDPSTLFTGSGMQPMIPYLLGETHPAGTRVVDAQKCVRAQDIDEVGDNRHTTFFEMLGNWSFGDYFKQEQIPWMFEFLTKVAGLNPAGLYITVFRGSDAIGIPRDDEAVALWQKQFSSVGIDAKAVDFSERDGLQGGRIFFYDETKNWWSRAGVPSKMPVGEPGGPDSEMFWDFGESLGLHASSPFANDPCHVNCDCGRFLEIGNNVFMAYRKTHAGFEKLAQRNVDFGGGLERVLAARENTPDVFLTDAFVNVIRKLEGMSGKSYGIDQATTRSFRVIADHIRAATFLIGDPQGIAPSNVGQGYVVRRLIRRAIREGRRLGLAQGFVPGLAGMFVSQYGTHYTELETNRETVLSRTQEEEEKFNRTLEKGLKEFEKRYKEKQALSGEDAFVLYGTFGFPWELSEELAREQGQTVDRSAFESEFLKHQTLSRAGAEKKFAGGLADHSEETTRLHTATHLLHRALKNVLGEHVAQKGSNITAERLRFDFSHPEKMTQEQLETVESMVNKAIQDDLPMGYVEMTVEEAKASGAIGYFEDKYAALGGKIKVYTAGDDARGYYSKEICGGPHVTHTGDLGSFKILKEEAVSAGVRRIKATVSGPKA